MISGNKINDVLILPCGFQADDMCISLKVGSCPDDDNNVQFYFLSFSV